MAHELSLMQNGRYAMAYVGETPWHSLGQPLTKGAPLETWAREAGFEWEAKSATPRFDVTDGSGIALEREASAYQVLYRSDTGAPLSIVSSNYQPVQPRELLEFFREEIEAGGWYIHTAGVLRGGRKLWVMASTDDAFATVKGLRKAKGETQDKVALNILLATSLDGSMRTTAKPTTVRVVCANTVAMALREGSVRGMKGLEISHRSQFNPRAIKKALGIAVGEFEHFMSQAQQMAETPMALDEAREILATIFKSSAPAKPALDLSWLGDLSKLGEVEEEEEPQDTRASAKILELFQGAGMGSTLSTSAGTRWGLFNAITQHVDHGMGRSRDTGLDSAWFGHGDGLKSKALQLLAPEAA